MEFRKLKVEDYNELYTFWNSISGMGLRSLDDSEEGIKIFLKRNPNTNFVCIIRNKIVGSILCGHDGRRGYIYHAAVDPEFRRSGIGKNLTESVFKALKEEGINKLGLVVFKHNEIGNSFWESTGWELREDLNYYSKSLNEENI